jgi:hypothetical protein
MADNSARAVTLIGSAVDHSKRDVAVADGERVGAQRYVG